MVAFSILSGGYTALFTRFLFQTASGGQEASLTVTGTFPAGSNASWIELSPVNRKILYATNEDSVGSLLSFKLDKFGAPSLGDTIASGGDAPAFANTFSEGREALVLNYFSGNGRFVPIEKDLLTFGKPQPITFQAPTGGVSHPHFFNTYGEEVFVADLGADKVWRISKFPDGTYQVTGFLPQPEGSGPRRFVIAGRTIYVLHELDNTLTQQTIPASRFSISAPIIASVVTTQAGVNHTAANGTYHSAELLMPAPSKSFPKQYLYTSNRDTGIPDPKGDTIAIFAINPLRKVAEIHTGLDQIRGMEFGGEEDRYLIAAGLTGGGVVVFERVNGGAGLKVAARNVENPAQDRSTFVWL